MRVVNHWNNLPRKAVESLPPEVFTRTLDIFLKEVVGLETGKILGPLFCRWSEKMIIMIPPGLKIYQSMNHCLIAHQILLKKLQFNIIPLFFLTGIVIPDQNTGPPSLVP